MPRVPGIPDPVLPWAVLLQRNAAGPVSPAVPTNPKPNRKKSRRDDIQALQKETTKNRVNRPARDHFSINALVSSEMM
jgi:hypothetical protein